jgi:hypothetical protein
VVKVTRISVPKVLKTVQLKTVKAGNPSAFPSASLMAEQRPTQRNTLSTHFSLTPFKEDANPPYLTTRGMES